MFEQECLNARAETNPSSKDAQVESTSMLRTLGDECIISWAFRCISAFALCCAFIVIDLHMDATVQLHMQALDILESLRHCLPSPAQQTFQVQSSHQSAQSQPVADPISSIYECFISSITKVLLNLRQIPAHDLIHYRLKKKLER